MDGLIWEAEHAITSSNKKCLAFGVLVFLLRVHPTIEIDGQAPLDTAEIEDKRTNWMLAPKFQPVQASCP